MRWDTNSGVLLLLPLSLLAAEPPRIPGADLRADAAVLRRSYETLHPGLYRYNTRTQMDAAFAELDREFGRDRTLAEAYLAISRLAAKVKCGHTYANFYNQSKAVQNALFRAPRLPFEFRWLGERMVVTKSHSSEARLRPGAEVLSINGHPAAAVLRALLPYARADGGNDTKRVSYFEVQGLNEWEAFDIYFPLLFPLSSPRYALAIRRAPGAARERISVDGLADRPRAGGKGAAPWEFRFLDGGAGYLRMTTWALYNSKWDWKQFLAATFSSLIEKQTGDLIIDLRGNEGGLGIGDAILERLIEEPLPAEPVRRLVRYRSVPQDLRPTLDTWDRSFFDWGEAAMPAEEGFYRLRRYDNDEAGSVIRPVAPRFTGRVWVLVSAGNSSATFEFARAITLHRLGTLVGQTTGGNQRGINGGAFFFLRLPKSGIELDVPLIGQFATTPKPDAGLDPGLRVVPSIAGIAAGRDEELEAVLARIKAAAPPGQTGPG